MPPLGHFVPGVRWAQCFCLAAVRNRSQAAAGESSRISDPTLVRWTDEALNHILTSASSPNPVPLALYLRGDLSASGSFPSYRSKDAKSSFRDFEAAANAGYVKSWFRIGRAYEDFGDIRRAVGAYEKGVERGDCGSTYRLAMAYLLGQIGVTADVSKAMALLKRAADTADLDTPQRELSVRSTVSSKRWTDSVASISAVHSRHASVGRVRLAFSSTQYVPDPARPRRGKVADRASGVPVIRTGSVQDGILVRVCDARLFVRSSPERAVLRTRYVEQPSVWGFRPLAALSLKLADPDPRREQLHKMGKSRQTWVRAERESAVEFRASS